MTKDKYTRFLDKKIVYIVLVIVLIVALFLSLEITHVTHFILHRPTTTTNSGNGPTPAQLQQEASSNTDAKRQAIEHPATGQAPVAPTSSNLTVSARQETNGTVTVLTKLRGIGNGSCTLNITNGGRSTSQTADVIYQSEYSTCAGFSIPINTLGAGSWNIHLSVTSNGTTASQSIIFEVK